MNEIIKNLTDSQGPYLAPKSVTGDQLAPGGIPLPEVNLETSFEHDQPQSITREEVAAKSIRGHEAMIEPTFIPSLEPETDTSSADPAAAEAAGRIITMPPDARRLERL